MEGADNEWASEPIAIIGLSCKFAGDATSPEKLWQMLAEGRNAWSKIPDTRFNAKGTYHPDPQKLSTVSSKLTLLHTISSKRDKEAGIADRWS
jgi:acyl transferase domain-containing protein